MNFIDPINIAHPAVNIPALQEGSRLPTIRETQLVDRVEISELAQRLSKRGLDINDIRVDKVLAVREAITNGTYVTKNKIDITVNRLLDVLKSDKRWL